MDEKYEKLMAGFIAQNQTEAEKAEMEAAITAGTLDLDKLNELSHFNNRLSAVATPEPGERLRSNFYQMLAEEKRKEKSRPGLADWFSRFFERLSAQITIGQLAYSAVVLVLGVALGLNYNRPQNTG